MIEPPLETPTTGPLLVALSGGLDSVALLTVLADRAEIVSAHIDHGLRDSSHVDASFCRKLAARLDIHHLESRLELTGRASQHQARYARYAALGRLADSVGAEVIATAHHLDDQIEGLFMARKRGIPWSPMEKLSTFDVAGKSIWRPFLSITRTEIAEFARRHEMQWAEDPTNDTPKYERNRARAEIRQDPILREELLRAVCSHEAPREITFRRVSSMRVEAGRDEVEELGVQALGQLVDALAGASVSFRTLEEARIHLDRGSQASLSARGAEIFLGRTRVLVERSFGRGREFLEQRDAGVVEVGAARDARFHWFDYRLDISPRDEDLWIRSAADGDKIWDGIHTLRVNELMRSRGIEACDRWKVPILANRKQIVAVGDLRTGPGCEGISITRRNV